MVYEFKNEILAVILEVKRLGKQLHKEDQFC